MIKNVKKLNIFKGLMINNNIRDMSDNKKMINFNDLPSDIMSLIFKINRDDAFYKKQFKNVLNEINEINDKVRDELIKYDDNDGGFFTADFIKDNNLNKITMPCDLGNGCLMCDLFLCDLKNKDYYMKDMSPDDEADEGETFFYNHAPAYEILIYMISMSR